MIKEGSFPKKPMEQTMVQTNQRAILCGTLAVFGMALAIAAGPRAVAQGQAQPQGQSKYDVLPVHQIFLLAERAYDKQMSKDERKKIQDAKSLVQKLRLDVGKVLRGSTELSLDDDQTRARFDAWYTRYYFARLTHQEHLDEWPKTRQELLKILTQPTVPAKVHDHVVDLTMQVMMTIAKGNYHPVARYNAMLLIGKLNNREAALIGETKRLPVPSIQALASMLNELENPNQIDAVRVAALVGILRHVRMDRQLPGSNRRLVNGPGEKRIVDLMLSLVNAKDPPAGRSREGHDWMRRRAVEILGWLGSVGDNDKVFVALDALVADDAAPVSLRCAAAEALGRLNYPARLSVNVVEMAKKLGALGAYACLKEARRVELQQEREQKEKAAASGVGAYGAGATAYSGGYGGGMPGMFGAPSIGTGDTFDPLAYRIDLTRRRVKYQTLMVKRGLAGPDAGKQQRPRMIPLAGTTGASGANAAQPEPQKAGLLALAKSEDDQKYVQKVVKSIDEIIGVADDASFKDITSLITEIRNKVTQLENECGIVAQVDKGPEEGASPEEMLANPLDALGTGLGADLSPSPPEKPPAGAPAKGGAKPPAKGAGQPPAKGAAAPAPKAPAAPPAKPPGNAPQAPAKPPAGAGAAKPPTPAAAKTP